MHFLIRLVVNAIALMIVAYLFNGHGVTVTGPIGALVAAFVLGIINAILRPILVILTFPIQIVTLGLFTLVINGVLC
jgi:putative membrane protein